MRRQLVVGVLVSAMLSTACGARFSDEERAILIADAGRPRGAPAGQVIADGGVPNPAVTSGPVAEASPGTLPGTAVGAVTVPGTTTAPGSTTTTTTPGTSANPGATNPGATNPGATNPGTTTPPSTAPGAPAPSAQPSSGASPTPAPSQASAQPGDTRAAPAGGNGGATDVGVTADMITISNISDISGAVPGLFADAQQAVTAYIAKFTTEEGTVYGRQVRLLNRDAKLDTNENRRQYIAACDDSLAVVGSMSAFEQGATGPLTDCGLVDLRTASVNPTMQDNPQVVSTDAMKRDFQPLSPYRFWKEAFGDAYTRAGAVFINADTTQAQTALVIRGTETIGYNWVAKIPVALTETNYAPIVIQLQDNDVEFVFFQGAYQQAVRLAQAMKQQQYTPAVYALQSNTYTPDLIASGGDAIQGAQLSVPSALVSEISLFPELAEYDKWLKQVAPGATPTSLGMYAWASAKLFIQSLKDIGPEITRAKLLAHLNKVDNYDGGGLIPPQHIGSGVPADCDVIIAVQGDSFVRVAPSQPGTFRCGDGPVEVRE